MKDYNETCLNGETPPVTEYLILYYKEVNPVLNVKWKHITGLLGKYQISNSGLIKSLQREVKNGENSTRVVQERLLKLCVDSKVNYLNTRLSGKSFLVHRLVATAFCEKGKSHTEVNHIDGNKLNNNAYNLEWCTSSENKIHAYKTGLRPSCGLEGTKTHPQIGKKFGNSSQYNNVTWDRFRNKWTSSIKHKGKPYKKRRFSSEIEAAKWVDTLLDEVNDSIRPRNFK